MRGTRPRRAASRCSPAEEAHRIHGLRAFADLEMDLRAEDGAGLADPVRHDDDPPVPAGPVGAGEPGRP